MVGNGSVNGARSTGEAGIGPTAGVEHLTYHTSDNVHITSARDLAYAANDQLKLGLTPRPWNRHAAADTFWWLAPSTEWPAYRYGKLAFSLAKDVPRKDLLGLDDALLATDAVFAGFNVEKGYGSVATFVNPALRRKPAQILDPQWLWYELTDGAGAARFSQTLASAAADTEIYLYVVSSYVHDRDSGIHVDPDALMFKCSPVGLQPMLHRLPVGALRGAETVVSFASLAERLRKVDDYHWVDVYAGAHVPRGDVDVTDLHRRVLSYFDAWLR